MTNYVLHIGRAVIAAVIVAGLAGPVSAQAQTPKPQERFNSSELWFDGFSGYTGATLKISGPDGFRTTIEQSAGTPIFQLRSAGPVSDGTYQYELSAASPERVAVDRSVNNGRGDAAQDTQAKPFYLTGAFTVSRGAIVPADGTVESSDQ